MTIGRRSVLASLAASGMRMRPALAQTRSPGSMIYAMAAYPPNLRPFENTGTSAVTVKTQVMRGLLGYDPAGNPVGELAERWVADGDHAYVFKLRDNAFFHNGDPVTATDVARSFASIAADKSSAYLRESFKIIHEVQTPDPKTVRIVLNQPSATFQYLVASPYAPIINARAVAADPTNFVSAGPYTIASIERGNRIELRRFEKYYKPGLPKSANLSMLAYVDDTARVAALLAGDVDIIEQVPWPDMDSLLANPAITLSATDGGPFLYLVFNLKTGRFTDQRLRQAVGHAIKREDVVKAALFSHGAPLDGLPIVKGAPMYTADVAGLWPYDPDRSKALLRQAGLADGFSTRMLSSSGYASMRDAAVVMQQNLADVGIRMDLDVPDFATRVSLGTKGQFEMALNASSVDFNDPDAWSGLIGSGLSADYHRSLGFENAAVADLLARGRMELDPAKRRAVYADLQRLIGELTPIVTVAWRTQALGMRRSVKNLTVLPGMLALYSGSNLEHAFVA